MNIDRCDSCDRVISYNEDNWQQIVFDQYLPGQFIENPRSLSLMFCHDCVVSFIDVFELRHKIEKKQHICHLEKPCCEFAYKFATDGYPMSPAKNLDSWVLDPPS